MRVGDFNFDNILLNRKPFENSYENILIYLWHFIRNFYGCKSIMYLFDKIDKFIKIYDGSRYLVLFDPEKCDAVYDRIRYLISEKSGITYSISYNFARIRIDSFNSFL